MSVPYEPVLRHEPQFTGALVCPHCRVGIINHPCGNDGCFCTCALHPQPDPQPDPQPVDNPVDKPDDKPFDALLDEATDSLGEATRDIERVEIEMVDAIPAVIEEALGALRDARGKLDALSTTNRFDTIDAHLDTIDDHLRPSHRTLLTLGLGITQGFGLGVVATASHIDLLWRGVILLVAAGITLWVALKLAKETPA